MTSGTQDFTPEQIKKLEQAEKLFKVAGRSPAEAEAYTARAMSILEELNLDMSVLEQGGADKAKRADELHKGGRYKFQRELWQAVAELHFCFYWNQYVWDKTKISAYHKKLHGTASAKANPGGWTFQHRIVGRKINTVSVRNLCEYLEQTIERLTKEHLAEQKRLDDHTELHNSSYAISFRQGIAEEVINKVYKRREDILSEEKRKQHEAAERAAAAGEAAGTAVTLASVAKQEHEANYDHIHGEGAWARKEALRHEREAAAKKRDEEWEAGRPERARKAKEREDAYTLWAAANPKEAAKQEKERLAAARKRDNRSYRSYGRAEKETTKVDTRAYNAGRRAGANVSLDVQAGKGKAAGLL